MNTTIIILMSHSTGWNKIIKEYNVDERKIELNYLYYGNNIRYKVTNYLGTFKVSSSKYII